MRIIYLLLAALSYLTLPACSLTQPVASPTINNYELTAQLNTVNKPAKTVPLVLFINHTLSSPGYETTGIAYSKTSFQLNYFSRNRWIAPPAQMINQSLLSVFQELEYFKAIVSPPYIGQHDFRLDTRLLELKQDLQTQPSQIILKLHAQLIDAKKQTIIASKQFNVMIPSEQANPQAVVIAANKGLSQLIDNLRLFCIKNIGSYDT